MPKVEHKQILTQLLITEIWLQYEFIFEFQFQWEFATVSCTHLYLALFRNSLPTTITNAPTLPAFKSTYTQLSAKILVYSY